MKASRTWLMLCFIVTLALSLGATIPVRAETDVSFFVGGKSLDADDWPDNEDQGAWGIETTFGPKEWPVQVAVDMFGSGTAADIFNVRTDDFDVRGNSTIQSTGELDVGVRKIWTKGRVRPYVGGGVAMMWGRQERRLLDSELPDYGIDPGNPEAAGLVLGEDDVAPGYWVNGGVSWRLTKRLNLGLEMRYTAAELDLNGRDVQAGGASFGAMFGYTFGKGRTKP